MKGLFAFLRRPPLWFCALFWAITLAFIAGSIAAVVLARDGWYSYLLYGGAGVTTAYSVYLAVRCAPAVRQGVLTRADAHAFTRNLIHNYGYRTIAFFSLSLALNVLFALFNLVLGILNRSVWYGALAAYYFALALLRCVMLVKSVQAKRRAQDEGEVLARKLRLYRACGWYLLALEAALAAAVTQLVAFPRPASGNEIVAIASAAYTFTKCTYAVYNVVKVRRKGDLVLQAFRNINLTDAAVSLLALQVTLVTVFSAGQEVSMRVLSAALGFAVCSLTIAMGIFMIKKKTPVQTGEEGRFEEDDHDAE